MATVSKSITAHADGLAASAREARDMVRQVLEAFTGEHLGVDQPFLDMGRELVGKPLTEDFLDKVRTLRERYTEAAREAIARIERILEQMDPELVEQSRNLQDRRRTWNWGVILLQVVEDSVKTIRTLEESIAVLRANAANLAAIGM